MSGMIGIQSVHDPFEHRFTLGTGTFYMLHDSDLFWRAFQDLKWFLLHHVFMYWSTCILFIEPIPILLHWHCHIANFSWPLPSSLLVFLLGSWLNKLKMYKQGQSQSAPAQSFRVWRSCSFEIHIPCIDEASRFKICRCKISRLSMSGAICGWVCTCESEFGGRTTKNYKCS